MIEFKRTAKVFLFFVLCFSFCKVSHAQSKSKMRVYTKPSDAVIKMDTMHLQYGKTIMLDSGIYEIEAWAPKRELVKKKVIITQDQFKTVPIKLPYTKEYKKYRTKKRIYTAERVGLRYGLVLGYAIFAASNYFKIQDLEDQADQNEKDAQDYRQAYQKSFWSTDISFNRQQFELSKAAYDENVKDIDENWQKIQIGAGITAVLTYFTWKLSNKLNKPSFSETPKLSQLQVNPSVSPNSTALQIKYQF